MMHTANRSRSKASQQEPKTSTLIDGSELSARFRILGLFPLVFFLLHTLYYLRHGGLSYMLWMCNIGNLVLAAGLFLGRPLLIRVAVFWLLPGLPLWIWYIVLRGEGLFTSALSHIGGLMMGAIAISKVRADRRTWLHAFAWYLLVQQICRLVTPAALNVNIAHRIYSGWEGVFGAYWQFWLVTTLVAGTGLWIIGIILLKLLPPQATSRRPWD